MDARDGVRGTALMWAINANEEAAVALLIQRGADVNVKTTNDMNPLRLAVERERLRIQSLLLKAGAKMSAP